MRIGYACIPLGISERTNRGFILKNFNFERFYCAVNENLDDLLKILHYNLDNNIYMFRISSDIIPFGSHVSNNIDWRNLFRDKLDEIGSFIRHNNIRVSMHPGQYTVLNSPNEATAAKSIMEIDYHTNFLDSLSIDSTHKIVLHIGGVYNDKAASIERFITNFQRLSPSSQKRLIIENDERCFTIEDVIGIARRLSIPAVFDNLHHSINPSLNDDWDKILTLVSETWRSHDGNMKLHYSDQSESRKGGAHSDYVNTDNFLNYFSRVKGYTPDIMLEVKDKDISAIKCINALEASTKKSTIYNEWSKYKYVVMEKDYSLYKKCSSIINSSESIVELYKTIDYALGLPFSEKNFINTAEHVWGYFKKEASEKEKQNFFKCINDGEFTKAKLLLKKLSSKYNREYILESYYFIY